MGFETILVSKSDGAVTITLNRPDVLNAMNLQLVLEMDRAITEAEDDDEVKAIVVTGSGERAFSAGGDIHEQRRDAKELTPEEDQERRARRAECSWHVATSRKPTIGALNGLAYGGGSFLASAMDIRVGCQRTRFRFLAASYGRINSTWTLPQQIGWPMAKELLFTGRVVEAEEAYNIGLLNHLVPGEALMDKAMEIAAAIAENHPDSVQGIKKLMIEDIGARWQDSWQAERDHLAGGMRVPGVEEAFKEFIGRRGR